MNNENQEATQEELSEMEKSMLDKDIQAIENKIGRELTPTEIKLYDAKVKRVKAKQKELIKFSGDKLNELLKLYFETCKIGEEDSEDSKEAFTIINKDWKEFCNKFNRTQKYVTAQWGAFEGNVERIIKETNERIEARKNEGTVLTVEK